MSTTEDPSDPEYRSSLEAQNNFVGWYISGTRTSGVTCGTGVLHTSGTFAQCCVGNACLMNTRCADGILTEQDDNTIPCQSGFSCVTMELYSTYRIEDEVRRRVMCGSAWTAHTVYRSIPAETTSSEPSASSTEPPSEIASSTSSPTPSVTESPGDNDSGGGSQAWIAGAVIGPVFLIAAIVLGLWWYKRRRAAKEATAAAAAAQGGPDASTPALSQHYPQQHMAEYHDNPTAGQYDPRMSQMWQQQQQHQAAAAAAAGYGPPKSVSPHDPNQQYLQGYYAPQQQQQPQQQYQQYDGSGYYSGAPTELDSGRTPVPPQEMHSEPQR